MNDDERLQIVLDRSIYSISKESEFDEENQPNVQLEIHFLEKEDDDDEEKTENGRGNEL